MCRCLVFIGTEQRPACLCHDLSWREQEGIREESVGKCP